MYLHHDGRAYSKTVFCRPFYQPRQPTALCYLLYIPLDSINNAFSKLQAIADLKKQQEYSKGVHNIGDFNKTSRKHVLLPNLGVKWPRSCMHYHQTCLPNCISPLTLNCETTYHCSLNATPLAEQLNPVWKPSRPELRKALPQLQHSFDCTAWEQRGIKEFHCRSARPAAVTRCIFSRVEQHICSHDTRRWNVQCLEKKKSKPQADSVWQTCVFYFLTSCEMCQFTS